MFYFSRKSKEQLLTCHKNIQLLCSEVIKVMDFVVLCGYRGGEEQNELYRQGKSNAKWEQSKHNFEPSLAVDIAPYPIDWNNTERFAQLAGVMKGVAYKEDIRIIWGGDFKSIKDMPHFELQSSY